MLSLMVSAALSQGALAQENSSSNDTNEIEEIIVTAQKRAQAIQDVPVTLSAFDGDFLSEIGIAELDVLSEITPGLVIQEQSPNNPGFVIRGITSDSGSAQSSPRVSVYYNGTDVSRSRGSYFELYDIERVEIVKGPQATLFGTAASVGALSVITKRPEQDFSSELRVGTGNFSAQTASGFITGGSDLVQGRFAFNYRKRDGFIENIAGDSNSQNPGGLVQDDMHAIERTSFRPSIRFTPNDDLTIDVVYSYEKNEDSGTSFKNGLFAPTGGDTSPFSFVEMAGSPLSVQHLGAEKLGVEREVDDLSLTIEYALSDQLSFTSITATRSFESLEIFDADGTQAWFLEFAEDAQGDQFSQEFRIIHNSEKLTSIYGASYFTEDGSQVVPFSTEESIYLNCLGVLGSGLPCINSDGSVNILTPVLTQGAADLLPYTATFSNFGENDIYSVFADFSYAMNNALELTVGLRYVTEDKVSGYSSLAPNSVLSGGPLLPVIDTNNVRVEAKADFDDWLPRFNALYVLNDQINLYATISKGRRSEVLDVSSRVGPADGIIADVTEVPAEIIWNYETGIKGESHNRKLTYAASVFYQDYSDFQVTLQDSAGNFFTANAGSATNIGFEGELKAVLSDSFEVFANVGYIDAEIDDDSSNGNLAGNRFRLQPEWTASAGMFYSRPISSSLNLTSSFIYSYRSDVFFEPDNAPISGLDISEDAISLASARVGISNADETWSLTLFASNLFDKEYLVDAGNTGGSFGNPTFVAGPPRFYGIELSMKFSR
ncbi:TonB-dependent receptor [Glaciecola sp. XM2]|uniref:TonB-dependent receptor n=1 Tax=Glaciecola sp. XM2 TaxID=1914931 RepID=UPI0020327673|nr:TonB-dependent receptor [Glaciecola sp. XM2]